MYRRIWLFAACLLIASLAAATAAFATPITGTFTIKIFNGSNPPPRGAGTLFEQAVPGIHTVFTARHLLGTYSYTGPIDFSDAGGPDTIAGFLLSAGGSFTPIGASPAVSSLTEVLSSAGYGITTGISIHGTLTTSMLATITHDAGGIRLTQGVVNRVPGADAAPDATASTVAALRKGTFTLYAIEANGLPATLSATVPEPAGLTVLGVGLFGLGILRRRRPV